MNKRWFALLTCAVTAAAIVSACSGSKEKEPDYTVGICQFAQHSSLSDASQGFQDALTAKLGDRVSFDLQNAQGDYNTCTTIINSFVSKNADLILANSTMALQTAAAATEEIPILGTSITNYSAILQLNDADNTTGKNISGTSDLVPASEQAAMIHELCPDADTIALLYYSAEPNSQYQVDILRPELEQLGYSCQLYTFSDSNDIMFAAIAAASQCDVLYIPADNMIAANAELIANVCTPSKIPVITADQSTCQICGAATLSADYYQLGYASGEMAARILADGEDISKMPIQPASKFKKLYNEEICNEIGLTVPDGYTALKAE